jgi:predicted RNA methylase
MNAPATAAATMLLDTAQATGRLALGVARLAPDTVAAVLLTAKVAEADVAVAAEHLAVDVVVSGAHVEVVVDGALSGVEPVKVHLQHQPEASHRIIPGYSLFQHYLL